MDNTTVMGLLSGLRWGVVRLAMGAHRRLPLPVARAVLRLWTELPDPRHAGRDWSSRQSRLGGFIVENFPAAAESLAIAFATHPPRLCTARRLTRALIAGGRPAAAVPVLRSVTALHPESSAVRADLANALRRSANSPRGSSRYTTEALDRRRSLLAEARDELEQARRLDPDEVGYRLDLATVLLDEGRTTEGLELVREIHAQNPSVSTALALAKAMHRSEVADFDAAAAAYEEALQYEPNNPRTLQRLSSVTLRTGSWAGWDTLASRIPAHSSDTTCSDLIGDFKALFLGSESTSATELTAQLITRLRAHDDINPALLHSISARLQTMGEFSLGFEVRHALAERIRQSPSNHMPHLAPFRRWSSASVSLGRATDVEAQFQPYPWNLPTPEVRAGLDTILADAEFTSGKVGRLTSLAAARPRGTLSPSDIRMSELVAGRRIAIVGPGLASGAFGAEIDDFDVVIRTRYSQSFVNANQATSGSRTDIAYYSGTDVHALIADAMPAAEAGTLQLVVARPVSYSALAGAATTAPWLRFYNRDFSLILNGGPLGLTRILYDLLQFEPAEVSLYNADYYTGAQPFAVGYRSGVDSGSTAGSIVMDLFRAHDLLADFVIHRNLFARGVLSGPPEVERIARLTPEEYTAALERAWRARTSPAAE